MENPAVSRPIWLLTLIVVIASLFISGLIAFVGQYVYAIILFPVLMGLAGGFFAVAMGFRLKMGRRDLRVILGGFLLSVVIYLAYRYFDYLLVAGSTDVPITLEEYLSLSAKLGISISRLGSGLDIDLSESQVWIYWLVELLGTGLIGGFVAVFFKIPDQPIGSKPS